MFLYWNVPAHRLEILQGLAKAAGSKVGIPVLGEPQTRAAVSDTAGVIEQI